VETIVERPAALDVHKAQVTACACPAGVAGASSTSRSFRPPCAARWGCANSGEFDVAVEVGGARAASPPGVRSSVLYDRLGPIMAIKPIPEGYDIVSAHVAVDDAARAIAWYATAFGTIAGPSSTCGRTRGTSRTSRRRRSSERGRAAVAAVSSN
jgi:hypothetical protein